MTTVYTGRNCVKSQARYEIIFVVTALKIVPRDLVVITGLTLISVCPVPGGPYMYCILDEQISLWSSINWMK